MMLAARCKTSAVIFWQFRDVPVTMLAIAVVKKIIISGFVESFLRGQWFIAGIPVTFPAIFAVGEWIGRTAASLFFHGAGREPKLPGNG